jgi:hypothetical protein
MKTLRRGAIVAAVLSSLVALPADARAQASPPPRQGPPPGLPPKPAGPPQAPPLLRIFLDCWECDIDHLRRNVRFVDYVRDRSVADLHVLVTTQSTGGGGSSWDVKFIGLGRFEGVDRSFQFTTPQIATSDERRREFARIFRLGLVAYAADTPPAPRLDVTFRRPPPPPGGPATSTRDPWRRWVFRTNASASLSGEASSEFRSYRLSGTASRITEAWKINITGNSNYNESLFTLSDGREIKSLSESWGANGLVVKSLNSKWSWGNRASISASSFSNTERAYSGSSGIEFDFFPYSESNRRSLTLQFMLGATTYRYRELTIFDKLRETVPHHTISMSLGLRQPWGSVGGSTSFQQHLNHTDRYRLSMFGNADVRLFKGFSFYMWSSYSRIRDQISLRKGTSTPEEILLRLNQQATGYSYNYSVGFSYSFGSIFTSIVNPRFSGTNVFFF